MSDDPLSNMSGQLEGPSSIEPDFFLVESLEAVGLSAGEPSFGTPELKIPPITAQGLVVSAPTVGQPDLVQIPALRPLVSPNRFLGSKLLYRGATGLEKAFADTDSERITGIDAELIRAIWNPYTCPLKLLPYLAFAMGVGYWNDRWSETTKRAWVAYQMEFKSIRGTQKALEIAVDYAGRDISRWGFEVTKVTTRPQRVFSGPSLTREQREAWLQQLPQVRVWRVNEPGIASKFKSFYGSSYSLRLRDRRFCLNKENTPNQISAVPTPTDAISRLKRRARWVEGGVETDVTVTDFGNFFQLHKSGVENGSVYCDRPFNSRRHFIPSTAGERLITIEPAPTMPWRTASTPTLQSVTSEPERVIVSGERGYSVFCDVPLQSRFYIPTTAPFRIFQRFAVLDPSVRQLRARPVQFMGTGRYGFPSFTAWASVKVGNVKNRWAAGEGVNAPGTKFFVPHDGSATEQVRRAAVGSKALRDKILIKTGREHKFVAGRKPVLADIDVMPAE